MSLGALEQRDRTQGRKEADTKTGNKDRMCARRRAPLAGTMVCPCAWGWSVSPGSGQLWLQAAVTSGFGHPTSQACLREAADCRREVKWGTGSDTNRNPNAPLLQDILKRVQVTPKSLPLYTELPMSRYRDISRKARHPLSQPRKKAGDIIVQF